MKKCPYCNKTFPDSVMRCPEDKIFLLSDTLSDFEQWENQGGETSRRDGGEMRTGRIVRQSGEGSRVGRVSGDGGGNRDRSGNQGAGRARLRAADPEPARGDEAGDRGAGDNGGGTFALRPGRTVSGAGDGRNGGSGRFGSGIDGVRIRRSSYLRRVAPVLRIAVPAVLILVAVILVVAFWSSIRPILSCLTTGAIIGGALALFLALRFGRHFNIDAVFAGAIVGGVLACFIQYNILGFSTGLSELIYALGPIVIILIGLWILIRSVFR